MLTIEARLTELMRQCREEAHQPTYRDLLHVLGSGAQEFCRFPDCKCPMDPGPEPDWCARGLPHAPRTSGVDSSFDASNKPVTNTGEPTE